MPDPGPFPSFFLALVAALTSAVSLALAGLFACWAAGGRWPAGSEAALAARIVRIDGTTAMPNPVLLALLCVIQAAGAALAWALVLVPGGGWAFPLTAAGAGLALVHLFRGAAPFTGRAAFSPARGTVFDRWDKRLYGPLALALGTGYAVLTASRLL